MNTDWNSPQGDFDTAEKQGELLMLLSRQQVTVHTWDDPDFDYMEEQDLALVVQSPSGTEDLLIELCGEFSVFFEKWHGEYAATAEGYAQLQQDITAILDGKAGALSLYAENGWQGTVLRMTEPLRRSSAAGRRQSRTPPCLRAVGWNWCAGTRHRTGRYSSRRNNFKRDDLEYPPLMLWIFSAEKIFKIEQCRSVCGRSGIAFSREGS